MRKCALEAAQAARYTAHGHAHAHRSTRQLQRCRCSCSCRCRCSSCRCRCRRQDIIILSAAPKSGKTFRLAAAACSAAAFLVSLFFGFLFVITAAAAAGKGASKRAAVFPRVALFMANIAVAFITFRFIHLFRCPLLVAGCFIHFGLGDLIRLSTLSPCICRSLFPFGNKLNKAKRGEGHAHSDECWTLFCMFKCTIDKYMV